MPQLDFKNPLTLWQAGWMFAIFALFYLLFTYWALPRVASVVDSRARRIAADLEAARADKTQAEAAMREMRAATLQAHSQAQAEIAAALAQAKSEAAAGAEHAGHELDARIAAAEIRIMEARAHATGNLQQVATDLAETMVARLTGRAPDRKAVMAAVAESLPA